MNIVDIVLRAAVLAGFILFSPAVLVLTVAVAAVALEMWRRHNEG